MIYLKFLQCLLLFSSIYYTISGEYFIKDVIPSYMYKEFNNLKEEVFPQDIRMNLSFSKISGTLLYSMDRNRNQLIINLHDEETVGIWIVFRKRKFGISLPELCGCKKCRFEILDLRIKIGYNIYLQCNGREVQSFKYEKNKEVDDAYPQPYSENSTKKDLSNEARLWLVNNPKYNDIDPNPLQMSGCIFNVWYNENLIRYTKISENVKEKCVKACTGNICNKGKCFETYNDEPLCDCTKTLLNGKYCNDTIYPINIISVPVKRQFDMIKVSWKSTSMKLLTINNSNVQIEINCLGSDLIFEYNYKNGDQITSKSILTNHYLPNEEYIMIVSLQPTSINIKLFKNKSEINRNIPINRDLTEDIFTLLTLQSDVGIIGIAVKKVKDDVWTKFHLPKYNKMRSAHQDTSNIQLTEKKSSISDDNDTDTSMPEKSKGWKYTAFGSFIFIVVVIAVGLIAYFKLHKKTKYYKQTAEKHYKSLGQKNRINGTPDSGSTSDSLTFEIQKKEET